MSSYEAPMILKIPVDSYPAFLNALTGLAFLDLPFHRWRWAKTQTESWVYSDVLVAAYVETPAFLHCDGSQ